MAAHANAVLIILTETAQERQQNKPAPAANADSPALWFRYTRNFYGGCSAEAHLGVTAPAGSGPGGASRRLQRLIVRTQFFPFTPLYRLIYWAALRVVTRRLQRLPGVLCVYLRRGLARGEAFYGLSDIDLLALVGENGYQTNAARVRNRYESLRRLIPMLGAGELALYSPAEFERLYKYSPFYRNRFDAGRRDWRRLAGEDAFRRLPPPSDSPSYLARFELNSAWRYLSQELLPEDQRPLYLRRYIAFKMLADTSAVWLSARGDAPPCGRKSALARVAALRPDLAPCLEQVCAWRDRLLAPGDFAADVLLQAFWSLAEESVRRQPDRPLYSRALRIDPLPQGEIERQLGPAALRRIEHACAELPGIGRAVLVPRLSFEPLASIGLDPSRFEGATADSYDLLLEGDRLPAAAALRECNRKLEDLGPRVRAFFCTDRMGLALQPLSGWTVLDAAIAPETFALARSAPAGAPLAVAGGALVSRPFEHAGALGMRARTLLSLFLSREAYRMPAREFFTVFWEALRAAWVALQAEDPPASVPVTSRQIVAAAAALFPGRESGLREILDEYERALRQEPSELDRYTRWAADCAAEVLRRADPCLAPPPGPPPGLKTELSISVIIATRNRAELLRNALSSLARQTRFPDEVVVVDNASTDATGEVALSFQGLLKLKLVREDRAGVPHARNAGLRTASGDVVAFIDDDCEAEPSWLAEIERPFLRDPYVVAAGGSLIPLGGQPGIVARFYESRMNNETPSEGDRPR